MRNIPIDTKKELQTTRLSIRGEAEAETKSQLQEQNGGLEAALFEFARKNTEKLLDEAPSEFRVEKKSKHK